MTRHAELPLAMLSILLSFALLLHTCAAYDFVRDYRGISFFDRWDFYGGWDNLTGGEFVYHLCWRKLMILCYAQVMSGG
jgi:hypothetical protein